MDIKIVRDPKISDESAGLTKRTDSMNVSAPDNLDLHGPIRWLSRSFDLQSSSEFRSGAFVLGSTMTVSSSSTGADRVGLLLTVEARADGPVNASRSVSNLGFGTGTLVALTFSQ